MELPCRVSVEVAVEGFTVKGLLRLRPKAVFHSAHSSNADLPLYVNDELIAWCEFEVLGNKLCVRLTELA